MLVRPWANEPTGLRRSEGWEWGSKGVLRLTLHVAYNLLNMGRGTRLTFYTSCKPAMGDGVKGVPRLTLHVACSLLGTVLVDSVQVPLPLFIPPPFCWSPHIYILKVHLRNQILTGC